MSLHTSCRVTVEVNGATPQLLLYQYPLIMCQWNTVSSRCGLPLLQCALDTHLFAGRHSLMSSPGESCPSILMLAQHRQPCVALLSLKVHLNPRPH